MTSRIPRGYNHGTPQVGRPHPRNTGGLYQADVQVVVYGGSLPVQHRTTVEGIDKSFMCLFPIHSRY